MRKLTFFLSFFLFAILTAFGQQLDMNLFKDMKPRSVGPAGMSGRVTTIDVDLSNPDIIYIGTASGGVWKSTSGGIHWEPIFDKQNTLSIGALVINQKNPSEIWVGTGEGNPRNSQNSGGGIYKSIDAGRTWKLMGLEGTKVIHRVLLHHDDPNIVYVGAQGSAWGPSKDRGVYKTTDGGATWEKILYHNEETGIADLVIDPVNPNKLIAAMWEFGRKPWFFNSGGEGSGIFITYDGGENWKKIKKDNGLPEGILGRIGLAIAPSKPEIVYALVEAKKNGLYKSSDGGHKWSKVADKNIGNRPFYYADIFVDSKNENRIFNLHSLVSKSEDGGKTFETILPFYSHSGVHPDHHAFWIHPDNPNYIIEGNDGGLNISRDGGKHWMFCKNLPLAQFYHINYDMEIPYNIMGGMQDNGSWIGPSSIWKRGGIKNEDWREVYFGDGFDVMVRPDDSRYGFAMSQGGYVGYFDKQTGRVQSVRPTHPEGVKLRFNWNAAMAQNPKVDCGIYYGSQFVHKSLDCGKTWKIISPDLTTNDPEKQKQGESGGLTIDATRAENFTSILAISPSSVDEDVIWVGTDDGNLQLTRDGGKTWNNLADKLPGCPKGSWVPHIEVSTKNAGEAYISVNNYRRNDWKPYAYKTTDYGATFTRIADQNKVEGYVMVVVQDPIESKLLFMGTDKGLFVSLNGGKEWTRWTQGFPSVNTPDLKIHPREHDLIIGTFGRAAYILDDIRPLRQLAKDGITSLKNDFQVYPAPDAYLSIYRSIDGARFIADAEFVGENRPRGAMLTFYANEKLFEKKKEKEEKPSTTLSPKKGKKKNTPTVKDEMPAPKEKAKPEKKKGKKAKIYVIDSARDTIRTFSTKVDTGFNRIIWDMRRKGVRFPSYKEPKADADEPRGPAVLPGSYWMVVEYKEHKDSAQVMVKADPRINISKSDLIAQSNAYDAYYSVVQKVTDAVNNLTNSKKTTTLVDEQLINAPDSIQTQMKEQSKAMRDSIQTLLHMVLVPEDYKGINREYPALIYDIFDASRYLNSSDAGPTPNGEYALKQVKEKAASFLEKVNAFYQNDWKNYQMEAEAKRHSLFKEYEVIKME